MNSYLVFVALFGVAAVGSASFTECHDSSDCDVTSVRINGRSWSPFTVRKGDVTTLQFSFTPYFYAEKLTMSLFSEGWIWDTKLKEISVSACSNAGCSSWYGVPQQITYSNHLDEDLLSGEYKLKLKLRDPDDDYRMCCLATKVTVQG